MLHGLRVSYTVHIHYTIRRPFSLFYSTQTKPNMLPQLSVIHHVPALSSYLCSIFKINAYILSVVNKHFFYALNPLENAQANEVNRTKPFQALLAQWDLQLCFWAPPHFEELTLPLGVYLWPLPPFTCLKYMFLPCSCLGSTAPWKQPGTPLCCPEGKCDPHSLISTPDRHTPVFPPY